MATGIAAIQITFRYPQREIVDGVALVGGALEEFGPSRRCGESSVSRTLIRLTDKLCVRQQRNGNEQIATKCFASFRLAILSLSRDIFIATSIVYPNKSLIDALNLSGTN